MYSQITRLLDGDTIDSIIRTIFIDKPLTILKTAARMGRSGVGWIYVQNDITGQKRASFLSFDVLLEGFWVWLSTVKLMAIALVKRMTIAEVIYNFVNEGDRVYHQQLGWVDVVEKDRTINAELPRFWVETEGSISIVNTWEVSVL